MVRRIYDGRPAPEALAARMKRDRVTGDVKAIVHVTGSIDLVSRNGRDLVPRFTYDLVTTGVFDGSGSMIAHYQTRSDGRIKGARNTDHGWGWMVPKEGAYRLATDEDLAGVARR